MALVPNSSQRVAPSYATYMSVDAEGIRLAVQAFDFTSVAGYCCVHQGQANDERTTFYHPDSKVHAWLQFPPYYEGSSLQPGSGKEHCTRCGNVHGTCRAIALHIQITKLEHRSKGRARSGVAHVCLRCPDRGRSHKGRC
eukprot:scaffold221_cov351-Pavlova_lutheri.AAC.20